MANRLENLNLALFCDFENIALGVRDAKYAKFDIKRVLERLLVKGSIVVKKAYCDWDRYKDFKEAMHEAAFELIEIPHVRQSGKNSADIRMVVDAIDLSYAKDHIDTFALVTGDSDFSPLASKLKENDRRVLGCGVRKSTSDLLINSCDEFIFYDDLVQKQEERQERRRKPAAKPKATAVSSSTTKSKSRTPPEEPQTAQQEEALDRVLQIITSLEEDYDPLWSSLVKQTLRRVEPGFNEKRFGFRNFNELLEAAAAAGYVTLELDPSRGNHKVRSKS